MYKKQNHIFIVNLKILLSLLLAWMLLNATSEFYDISWGTGKWYGELSLLWALLYVLFILFCISLFVVTCLIIWKPQIFELFYKKIISFREKLGILRWVIWLVIFISPILFFQYTAWGLVFQKTYIRILIWGLMIFFLTMLASSQNKIVNWNSFITSIILTSSAFTIIASLREVSNYPFSLGWSEGNRLWDYSVLFGRDIYLYPKDKNIFVLLDRGRQFIGGLIFLFPNVTIKTARLWVGLTFILPYLLLGLTAFRFLSKEKLFWLLAILWVLLFLKQGPIHPPLLMIATCVVLAWRSPYWIALPLMLLAGYFAQVSRFTWVFAPPLWIAMLEISTASFSDRKTALPILTRVFILAVAGLVGAFLLLSLFNMFRNFSTFEASPSLVAEVPLVTDVVDSSTNQSSPTYIERIIQYVTVQPYLWYRLLPNPTYGSGILFALFLAIAPLITIFIYLIKEKILILDSFQKTVIAFPLLAFLFVGLVASVKIGGGGDLHNMDMFLVGLVFACISAFFTIGSNTIKKISESSMWIKILLILIFVLPGFQSLLAMRAFEYNGDPQWLYTLADINDLKDLDLPPSQDIAEDAINRIQHEANLAQHNGEVLFIDQRQLLTFGYITDIFLIPQYEKKVLMNEALSSNASYFQQFYEDLALKRFSLIVSEPLRTPEKDSTYQFGEESNAWLTWVIKPILCYYEEKSYLRKVDILLLVPKEGTVDCEEHLPVLTTQ